jgi:hypothetical protein
MTSRVNPPTPREPTTSRSASFDASTEVDGVTAAAFDTRMDGPVLFTGQASRTIAQQLRHRGYRVLTPLRSFPVSKQNGLDASQAERGRTWGEALAFTASSPRWAGSSPALISPDTDM